MNKEYTSVSEMLADSGADESLKSETTKRIASRQIVKRLIALRVSRGKSQKDVAELMKCSQSRISKLENGTDSDLRLSDLSDYLSALEHDMSLFICKKEWQSFQQIKFCAATIRRCLTKLVELAGDDPEIEQGVSKAHVELLVNMVKNVVDSAKDLPSFSQMLPGIIEPNGSDDEELESRYLESQVDEGEAALR